MHRSCVVCVLVADFDVEEIMEGFTMGKKGMTNDIDEIMRETGGYKPGKAYIDGEWVETYGVDTIGKPAVYDKNSKNFHIFPNDEEEVAKISDSDKRLRNKIIKYCQNIGYFKFIEDKGELNDDKIVICKKDGSKGGVVTLDRKRVANGLYKYLSFYYNGKIYNISFMRFYIDKDNKVNCIFKQIQFDRTNRRNVNEDGICYPRTYQNHVNKLDKLIQDNKGKNFCYNPPVAYEAKEAEKAVEEIVKKFVEFVKKCEEYDTK